MQTFGPTTARINLDVPKAVLWISHFIHKVRILKRFFNLLFHKTIFSDVCSHSRALFLYAYTVKLVGKAFPAVKCTKNLLHQLECTNDIAYMVFDSNARSAPEGDYYLMTDSAGLTVDQFTWSNTNPFDLKEKGYLPFLNKMSTHGDGTNSFLD